MTSIRIGRLAGVEVSTDWSLLVLCALLVWTLESGIFPAQDPHLSHRTDVLMASVATVGFILGVLLHEVGHVLAARREGMRVDGIVLSFYGGYARFTSNFPDGPAEARVAFAGPLVSLLIGGIAVLVARAHVSEPVDAVASWLGYVNVSLGIFNLVPAVPLDGGRVLHGLIWRARGDEAAASRICAGIGRAFGYLLVTLGIALFMTQGVFSGVWVAFMGWFLLMGATSETQSEATKQALAGKRVGDLMTRSPVTVTPDVTIGRFVDEVADSQRHSTYPVVDGGRAVGLLPLQRALMVPRLHWDERTVRDCMVPRAEAPVVAESDAAVDALPAVAGNELGHALVLDGDTLVGIVSATDFARALETRAGARQAPATR